MRQMAGEWEGRQVEMSTDGNKQIMWNKDVMMTLGTFGDKN